jgi:hypothetical protein
MRGAIMAAGLFCSTFWASKKYERKNRRKIEHQTTLDITTCHSGTRQGPILRQGNK